MKVCSNFSKSTANKVLNNDQTMQLRIFLTLQVSFAYYTVFNIIMQFSSLFL